jgi:hypothetical protein
MLQGRLYGLRGAAVAARADELLAHFGLTEAAGRLVRTYSGGMQRRLDVALGLMHRPAVLFLDEPTTGLDPESRTAMWQEIGRLAGREGMTVLLTTHYLEEADRLASRLASRLCWPDCSRPESTPPRWPWPGRRWMTCICGTPGAATASRRARTALVIRSSANWWRRVSNGDRATQLGAAGNRRAQPGTVRPCVLRHRHGSHLVPDRPETACPGQAAVGAGVQHRPAGDLAVPVRAAVQEDHRHPGASPITAATWTTWCLA